MVENLHVTLTVQADFDSRNTWLWIPLPLHLPGSFCMGGSNIVCTHQAFRVGGWALHQPSRFGGWALPWNPLGGDLSWRKHQRYRNRIQWNTALRPTAKDTVYISTPTKGSPIMEKTPTLLKQDPVKYSVMLYSWGHFTSKHLLQLRLASQH